MFRGKGQQRLFPACAQLLDPDGAGLRALDGVRLPGARGDPAGVPAPVVGGEGCAWGGEARCFIAATGFTSFFINFILVVKESREIFFISGFNEREFLR